MQRLNTGCTRAAASLVRAHGGGTAHLAEDAVLLEPRGAYYLAHDVQLRHGSSLV
jgi:hypothetical protein